MNYYSITIDFTTAEPYARSTLEEHVKEFVTSLGGTLTAATYYADEGVDE